MQRFEAALDDDFNTPEALAVLQGVARELNAARAAGRCGTASRRSQPSCGGSVRCSDCLAWRRRSGSGAAPVAALGR